MEQNIKATTRKTTFGRTTTVRIGINADPGITWKLLTNAADFSRWNSTVLSIKGSIAAGEMIKLISALAPKRTFKLKIREFIPGKLLAWGDGQGLRVYTLAANSSGIHTFTMKEKIGGFLFPLYAKHIPSFDQSFEQFAADLKREAELIQNYKKQ